MSSSRSEFGVITPSEIRRVRDRQRLWLVERRLEVFEKLVDPHRNIERARLGDWTLHQRRRR